VVENEAVMAVPAEAQARLDRDALPLGYANFSYTGAESIWRETGYGAGSLVAVVDSGVTPNGCLAQAVIGAPGYPEGYNATGDGISATDASNHWHGTVVAGAIASACALNLSARPGDLLYQAISTYLPWPPEFVPIYGQAPRAQIYPVKVFPTDGKSVPTSIVLDGLDHILTLKRDGLLDIDIVNLSLGGPTVFERRNAFDRFLVALQKAKILVVSAAGNSGPMPASLTSPATSFAALAVGALDYAPSSRVLYEYLGLINGRGAGQGLVMRPTDEIRVANFSSRGPLRDGHLGPDLSALGVGNFYAGPTNHMIWGSGTSFAAATVSGVAALLNAFWENRTSKDVSLRTNDGDDDDCDDNRGVNRPNRDISPRTLLKALLLGANSQAVSASWQDVNDQGYGALDAVAALEKLKCSDLELDYPIMVGELQANILGEPVKKEVETYESDEISLLPAESFDLAFEIAPFTSKVTIEVFDIATPDNSAYAIYPNALEVHVQSAKQAAFPHPISEYWNPNDILKGESFSIEIEDGPWTLAGAPVAYQPMEPGLMKVSLAGDFINEAPVSFKVRIVRENLRNGQHTLIAQGLIHRSETILVPVEIPAGAKAATFKLVWRWNWAIRRTNDIDMVILDPGFNQVLLAGATGNAPERAAITNPTSGTWYVYIVGFEMYRPDHYWLYMRIK
jgi:subtilisin family serine protease